MKENINLVNTKNESIEKDYTRTLQFIFIKATLDLFPNAKITIQHSVGKGIFGEIFKENALNEKDIENIKLKMDISSVIHKKCVIYFMKRLWITVV